MNQKGAMHLVVLVVFLLVLIAAAVFVVSQGIIKLPSKLAPGLTGKSEEPTVALQTQYQNPFDGKFVNPFAGYKNPFDALK